MKESADMENPERNIIKKFNKSPSLIETVTKMNDEIIESTEIINIISYGFVAVIEFICGFITAWFIWGR